VLPAPIDDPTGRRRPAGRYDPPSRVVSRSVAVVLSVLFLGFLFALAWVLYLRFASDDVPFQLRGYEVVDDSLVIVEFDVTPPADGTAWCLVRARNAIGEEIGREFVPIEPVDGGDAVRVRHELAVTDEAVTGEVPRCRPVPPAAGEPTTAPAEPVSP
jgi:hypothetical protein